MSNGKARAEHHLGELRKNRSRAVSVIFAFFTTSFFVIEGTKALVAHHLVDYLYLVLLLCLALKVVTWILISEKELDFLEYWLDPKFYEPPSEMSTIFALAITLSALILTARYPVLFGICYFIYAIGNLYGWWRLRHELQSAIPKTAERLREVDPDSAAITRDALDAMTAYYLKPPHVLRSVIILVASIATLSLAGYAYHQNTQSTQIATYCLCIFDIVLVEEASIVYYRTRFYSAIRPITAAENERKRQLGI
jgi:hypothetical protein